MGIPRFRCPGCDRDNLPARAFYKDKSRGSGRSNYCKECVRRRQRERRQRLSQRSAEEMAAARPDTQRCATCHEVKTSDQFYNSSSTPNALRRACKGCSTQAVAEWRKRTRNQTQEDK